MKRTTKLSSKGQVVIPADIRHELALERDSRFEVEVEGDTIVLRLIRKSDWRDYRGALDAGPSLTEALEEERRQERRRQRSKLDNL